MIGSIIDRYIIGDCRETLRTLPDGAVQCCVTSPPYWGLRDYGHPGQLGLEPTPDEYVANMVGVFHEVKRVLRDDGTLFLNLGDSYFSGAQRGAACGSDGIAPEDSSARDCLCRSLCGACRVAYRTGMSHSGRLRESTLPASSVSSTLGHTGAPLVHLPTSDFPGQSDHSGAAIPCSPPEQCHDAEQPLASPASTTHGCARPRPVANSGVSIPAAGCQLCGRSLLDCAPVSARMEECSCDRAGISSDVRIARTDASGSAYQNYTTASLKPKDLVGIPWRLAFALQADGWYLRSDIIWHKPNPMPESVTDRPTKAHEYLFLLAKSERYAYDADAISEAASNPIGVAQLTGQTKASILGHTQSTSALGANYGRSTRNSRTVWTIPTECYAGAHFATMPQALVTRCILAGCPVGGTVLDPFFGSGTVGQVAERLGRHWFGCELNERYACQINNRTKQKGLGI